MTLVGHVADTKYRLQFVVGGEIAKNGRKYRVQGIYIKKSCLTRSSGLSAPFSIMS
jgi:hypothetical protein